MFRLIANLETGEVKTFETITDLFDPRQNELFRLGNNLTVQNYFDIIKSLYSRENLQQYPKLFFKSIFDYNYEELASNFITKLLAATPDHLLWTLTYTYFMDISSQNRIQAYFYTANSPRIQDNQFHAFVNDIQTRFQYSFQGDNFPNELLNRLSSLEQSWIPYFNTYSNLHFAASNWVSRSPLPSYVIHFTRNTQIYNSTRNSTVLSPERLLERMTTTPDTTISCRNDFGELSFTITSPISKSNRSELYTVLSYNTNPCHLLKWPLICKNEHKPLLYGVELEVSTNYSVRDIIDACDDVYMIAKQDSSISGSCRNKMELVTIPMSLRRHKLEWAKWFSKIDYNNFDCTTETTNGMHVHIGKDNFLTPQHLRNFIWFITSPAHKPFTLALSERDITSFRIYSNVPTYNNLSKINSYIDCVLQASGLRGAVNVSSGKGTIEVRIFKGIVSYAAVLKNLEAVDAIFHFTRNNSFSQLTLSSFIAWLNSLPANKYTVLRKFLDQIDVQELVNTAKFNDLLHGCNTPEKVLQKILKSKIPITQSLVTQLNKRAGKRTFILNKDTKQIDIIYKNRSKIHFLDRVLEKKYLNAQAA